MLNYFRLGFTFVIGIVGMILIIIGFTTHEPWMFVIGPTLMLAVAKMESNQFLQILQVLVCIGGLLGVWGAETLVRVGFLIPLIILALYSLHLLKQLWKNFFGVVGLILLGISFASGNVPTLSFVASILISIHASIEIHRGVWIASVWVGLNLTACVIIVLQIFEVC
ncbi:MAG: hypothetical protein HYV41_04815 [Candidatus Magasanikbacteria bacterium]|nr:hypothetical protein [Candidatus Magasanikbacteria bacterium]